MPAVLPVVSYSYDRMHSPIDSKSVVIRYNWGAPDSYASTLLGAELGPASAAGAFLGARYVQERINDELCFLQPTIAKECIAVTYLITLCWI
jgi:hypothetical protein